MAISSKLLRVIKIAMCGGLVLLPALGAFAVQAQTTPRGGDAPVGRVLQATTCNKNDGVNISVAPQNLKIGTTVKFTVNLKSECQSQVGPENSASGGLYLYHGEYSPSNTRFESALATGFTISKEFLVTSQLFSVGPHLVGVMLEYCAFAGGENICAQFLGRTTLTVAAADTTGTPTLVGTEKKQDVSFNSISKTFGFVYNKAGSAQDAAKIEYYCGNENPPVKRFANIGQDVRCDYEKKAGSYTFTAQAVDASGAPIAGAAWSKQFSLTGNEVNQVGTTTPGLGDLAFGGFELFIGWILKLFEGALKLATLYVIGPFIETILSIHTYDDKFAQVIYAAWEIFRNLGNIFFILSIVAIGVATVFRISGWAVKDLLVKLIVGAILINFSLSIAQSILGIADTVQNQFLPNDTGAIREIVNHLFTADIFKDTPGNLGGFNGIIEQIMSFFLTFGSFIAFLGIAALLTVRVLFLWILLMLSPLPYIAMVLPISRSMSKKWWSEFGKWAFITPVIAFMLNLTALITVQTKTSNILQSLSNTDPSKTDGVVSGVMFAFASNAIPLGFLYMTLKAATAFGSGASGFVNRAAEKGVRAAFWPATAAGAAIGGGALAAGKYAGGLAAGVGKVPLNLARLKLAEGSQARAERLAGIGDQKATFKDKAMSLVFDSGKILDAKNKRLEEWRKDAQGYRAKALSHVEKNIVSLDGYKVRKARRALADANLDEGALDEQRKLLKKDQREGLLNQLKASGIVASDMTLESDELEKTLAEQKQKLAKDLNEKKTKLAARDVQSFYDSLYGEHGVFQQQSLELGNQRALAQEKGDLVKDKELKAKQIALNSAKLKMEENIRYQAENGLDLSIGSLNAMTQDMAPEQQAAFKAQFESMRTRSLDPKELEDMENEHAAIDSLSKSNEYIANRRRALGENGSKFTDDQLIEQGKKQAEADIAKLTDLKAKSKYMAFYGEEQVRREFTDAQSAKLPKEYDEGNNINQFRSAVARGDKFLALKTWELAEKEGDIKKLLKALQYTDDPEGYEAFMQDHFGPGGFNMGEKVLTDLRRESSKRNKAAGNYDLSEQVKFNADKGEYEVNKPVADRMKAVVDKMMGDSSAQQTISKLNTSSVFTNPGTPNAKVNELFKTFLSRMDLKDASGLKAVAERLPTAVAKQMVTVGKVLQSDEAVEEFRKQLIAHVKSPDGGALSDEQAKDFYLMIQKASQERLGNHDDIQRAYKKINTEYRRSQGYKVEDVANAAADDASSSGSGQTANNANTTASGGSGQDSGTGSNKKARRGKRRKNK